MSEEHQTEQQQKKLGLGMVVGMWIVVLLLFTAFFARWEDQRHNPNQKVVTVVDNGVREVVLQRNHRSHYITDGQINGQDVVFMLDTGATDISIPQRLAEQLGLKKGPSILFETANGVARGYLTRLERVAIGDIELRDIRASINPNVGDMEVLLGMSFLKHLEFTQRGDTLTLRQYLGEP